MAALHQIAKPHRVSDLQRFYKTGPGQYAQGDVFLGISVPNTRKIAAEFKELSLKSITTLLNSPLHEVRLCALIIITDRFKKSKDISERREIYEFYLMQVRKGNVNNWDLVDVSAPAIGEYLFDRKDSLATLKKLAKSESLWERRVAIVLTFGLIRKGEFDATLTISRALLKDDQDLIHKASGWMLREMGKRDSMLLRGFLKAHAHQMPRTMLRYSIEKFSETERKKWLRYEG